MNVDPAKLTYSERVTLMLLSDALADAEYQAKEFLDRAKPGSEEAKAAQSILNKLSNVQKAFVHEFGEHD